MTQFEALKGLYFGTHALVLGPDTVVYLADTASQRFVVERHGSVVDEGALTPAQAAHFARAASGARPIARTVLRPGVVARCARA